MHLERCFKGTTHRLRRESSLLELLFHPSFQANNKKEKSCKRGCNHIGIGLLMTRVCDITAGISMRLQAFQQHVYDGPNDGHGVSGWTLQVFTIEWHQSEHFSNNGMAGNCELYIQYFVLNLSSNKQYLIFHSILFTLNCRWLGVSLNMFCLHLKEVNDVRPQKK